MKKKLALQIKQKFVIMSDFKEKNCKFLFQPWLH